MTATRPRVCHSTIEKVHYSYSIANNGGINQVARPQRVLKSRSRSRKTLPVGPSASLRSETSAQAAEKVEKVEKAEKAEKVRKNTYQRVSTTVWPCECGISVRAALYRHVVSRDMELRVTVDGPPVSGSTPIAVPQLLWGLYRSSPQAWQHPEGVAPPGSQVDQSSGAMTSPMSRTLDREKLWTAKFSVPLSLIPLTFAFHLRLVYHESTGEGAQEAILVSPLSQTSLSPSHMAVQLGLEAGRASPLGPSVIPSSLLDGSTSTQNFAVFCRGASSVSLVLLSSAGGEGSKGLKAMEIALDASINRTGDVWHVGVPLYMLPDADTRENDRAVFGYGWRLDGDVSWGAGYRISPSTVLVDPFARSILYVEASAEDVDEFQNRFGLRVPNVSITGQAGACRKQVLSKISYKNSAQDPLHGNDSMPLQLSLESLCVLDLTKSNLLSICSMDMIAKRLAVCKALGVNAVILPPCYATDGAGRVVSFMALNPLFGSNGRGTNGSVEENFQRMVETFHENGIEIYMTIDSTLSADGFDDSDGGEQSSSTPISFRGLNHPAYYRPNGVLNMGNPAMQEVLLASLRRWAVDFGIDGYYFVHAENLTQDSQGMVVDAPLIAQRLCLDPLLSHLKLIAAPSDQNLLPRNGCRGFPHWGLWMECNAAFSKDVVDFWKGCSNGPSALARRLTGSADYFDAQWETGDGEGLPGSLAAGRRPSFSFNALNDSLQSLTARGEQTEFLIKDMVLKKSMVFTALVAQGTPVLLEEDINGDTNGEMLRFIGVMVRWRRKLSNLLLPPKFDSPRHIAWHGADGGQPDWEDGPGQSFLGFSVKGQNSGLFVGLNPLDDAVTVHLPSAGSPSAWRRIVDTGLEPPEDVIMPVSSHEQKGEGAMGLGVRSTRVSVGPKAAVLFVWGV